MTPESLLFRKCQESCLGLAKIMQDVRLRYDGKLEPEEERVLNASQFWCLFIHDFQVVLERTYLEPTVEAQKVFARVLSMMIVECFDDFAELLGKSFDADMRAIGMDESRLTGFLHVRLSLRGLRSRNEGELLVVRNVLTAHREHDARKQWDVMQGQELNRVRQLAYDLTTWSVQLLDALTPVIDYAAGRVVSRCGRYDQQVK